MRKTIMEEAKTILQQADQLRKLVEGNYPLREVEVDDNYLNETGAMTQAEQEYDQRMTDARIIAGGQQYD